MTERWLEAITRADLAGLERYEIPHPPGIRAKLDANESPYPLDEDLRAGLAEVLAAVDLNRYPDGEAREVRALVAAEVGCPPERLVFGNGSDELITLLVTAFSRPRAGGVDGRARVLYPVPSFVCYRIAALAQGVLPVEVPLAPDFQLDEAAAERALAGARPNLAFFALPNNPTGTLWPPRAVASLAARHPGTLFVVDEAYVDYAGETLVDLVPHRPNLVVMRTLSKIGLAALRVGYLVAGAAVLHELEKIRPPYNVGALNQAAAAWLLRHHAARLRGRIQAIVRERERLVAALGAVGGVHPFPTRANHVLLRVGEPGDGRATLAWRRLAERGVLVRNFDRPGPLSGCLRVTVGSPAENDLFLAALSAAPAASAG